jgi:SAM-dependent methyltransferase
MGNRRARMNYDDALDAFRQIYESDHWKGGSGEGSQVAATEPYRRVLASVLGGCDIRTVVDAGCGDWQFSRLIDWSGKRYLGVDIVPEMIAGNRQSFASESIEFIAGDVRAQRLPKADLLLCKDVLQHWDVESIAVFLSRNLRRYRYALITNDIASIHVGSEMLNADIPIGHWRPIDLECPPFDARAQWRFDFDIRGEWTKRSLLFVRRRNRLIAKTRRMSAYASCRGIHIA